MKPFRIFLLMSIKKARRCINRHEVADDDEKKCGNLFYAILRAVLPTVRFNQHTEKNLA